jgi:hypothetical protein
MDNERRPRQSTAPLTDLRGNTGAAHLQNIFSAISWALLVGVMFGGYSLLRMLSSGDGLSEHEEQFFRAGHAHAGVLNVIGILYGTYLGRTLLSARSQIAAWLTYILGVALMSGGFFVHMAVGEPGDGSIGTTLTATGGVILAVTVLFLAWHLFRARHAGPGVVGRKAYGGEEQA